jgi:hypothetical protein
VDEGGPPEPFLQRPIRSLLDLKIGTVLKAYFVYVGIGLVLALIGLIVVLSTRNHSASEANGQPGSISWSEDAGQTVTPAEYSSVHMGAQLNAVRSRFGEPASTGRNPLDLVSGNDQTCLGYRSSSSKSTLFLFCFEGGRLVDKNTF